jgi:hypothetical protein
MGERSIMVVEALCYKPEDRSFKTWWGNLTLSIFLILTAALGPEVCSDSDRNKYQRGKWKTRFLSVERCLCLRLTTSPPIVSRQPRKCVTLMISQPSRPPWSATANSFTILLLLPLHLYIGACCTCADIRLPLIIFEKYSCINDI